MLIDADANANNNKNRFFNSPKLPCIKKTISVMIISNQIDEKNLIEKTRRITKIEDNHFP